MRLRFLPLYLLLPWLGSCASVPKAGDLAKADHYRKEIQTLIGQRAIRADATLAHLEVSQLAGRNVTHVPITPELLVKIPSKDKFIIHGAYIHAREIDWRCRDSMWVPIFIRRPAKKPFEPFNEEDLFEFASGNCYELIAPGKNFVAYLSIFSLSVDLDVVVPKEKRLERIWGYALRNTLYKNHYSVRTDRQDWDAQGITVAEDTGYHRDGVAIIPHLTLFEIRRDNYYRILLVGKQTIALLAVIGPTSASVDELQAEAMPILKALRYEAGRR